MLRRAKQEEMHACCMMHFVEDHAPLEHATATERVAAAHLDITIGMKHITINPPLQGKMRVEFPEPHEANSDFEREAFKQTVCSKVFAPKREPLCSFLNFQNQSNTPL